MSSTLRRPIANATRTDRLSGDSSPWQEQAACRNLDSDAWFAEGAYRDYTDARETCVTLCPVRQQCLEMALGDTTLTFGMYGGLTPEERRVLRRRARAGTGTPRILRDPEMESSARDMLLRGDSDTDIAADLGIPVHQVRYWRRKHDMGASRSVDHQERLQLHARGLTDEQIGAVIGLTPNAVGKWRREKGLTSNGKKTA